MNNAVAKRKKGDKLRKEKLLTEMIVGTEWLIDASGCDALRLRDVETLRAIFERVIDELGLKVVDQMIWHRFPGPAGVTGLALLSESHLACHTYPEYEIATFNLYCCRERPRWNWEEVLSEMIGAGVVTVRKIERAVDNSQTRIGPVNRQQEIQAQSVGGERA
jgi:S-adenosylmethionine decarboxylase